MDEYLFRFGPWLWMTGIPVLFLAIVACVFLPDARQKYRRDANIPFEENDINHD